MESPAPQSPPRPPRPENLFCPCQRNINQIGVYTWKVSDGLKTFIDLHVAIKERQLRLAPFILKAQGRRIPSTPIVNPRTKMSSFCFIRMINDNDQDRRYRVDCLMRDTDWYFMGFRRELTLSEEEMQEQEKERKLREAEAESSQRRKNKKERVGRKQGWGTFFSFNGSNMDVPAFLKATMLNISGNYKDRDSTLVGGLDAVLALFNEFSRHQDKPLPDDKLAAHCYCLMTLVSEPTRLLSHLNDAYRRMALIEGFGSVIEVLLWKKMHIWGHLSQVVQHRRLENSLRSHELLNDASCRNVNLILVREAVGERGELLLIKTDNYELGIDRVLLEKIVEDASSSPNNGPADRVDPWL